jgi:hypothetical protein
MWKGRWLIGGVLSTPSNRRIGSAIGGHSVV